jgi:hypothetical protein
MPSPKWEMMSTQLGHSMNADTSVILAAVPVFPVLTPTALPTLAVHISHSAPAVPHAVAAPSTSAADIMHSHHDEMTWCIDGWLGGVRRCEGCALLCVMGRSQNRCQIANGEVVLVVGVIHMKCRIRFVKYCNQVSDRLNHWCNCYE